jgi:hypothetical protein
MLGIGAVCRDESNLSPAEAEQSLGPSQTPLGISWVHLRAIVAVVIVGLPRTPDSSCRVVIPVGVTTILKTFGFSFTLKVPGQIGSA